MNMFTSREQLLAGASVTDTQDLLTCALQLMLAALTIIDAAEVPSHVGAHLDHALQALGDYLVNRPLEGRTG